MIVILLVIIIIIVGVKMVIDAVNPIFETLCINKAKSIATIISNEQATNVMRQYSYEDLFTVEKDNDGNITMIKSNVIPINEIISDVAIKIQQELDSRGREDIEIALRKFYRSKFISWKRTRNKNKDIINRKCRNRFKK